MEKYQTVVLITGASRGIGKALAEHLSTNGRQVVITGRDSSALQLIESASDGSILAVSADACDPDAVRASVNTVIDRFARIDVLINNAGVGAVGKRLWDCDIDDWWRVQTINVRGPLSYMHAVIPQMIKQGAGTIINLGSYKAINPSPKASCYAASKAAIAKITDSVAAEVKEFGINVYCLSPGLVKTAMTRKLPSVQDLPDSAWRPVEKICDKAAALIDGSYRALSGRFLHVDDDLDILMTELDNIETNHLYQLSLTKLRQH